MDIEFDKEYLRELYFEDKAKDKKHRFQPDVVRGYQKAVTILAAAKCVEDLFAYNSLNYEALLGDKKGVSSVRCNKKYRLEFTIINSVEKSLTIKICRLLEISNHYK